MLLNSGERHTEIQKELWELRLGDQASDLRFLAALSSVRVFLADPSDAARAWAQRDLTAFSASKGMYDQVRILRMDGMGNAARGHG